MGEREVTAVRPGQVWQGNDPREAPGRKIRVVDVDSRYAHVTDLVGKHPRRILLGTDRPESYIRGYRLVEDVAS